MSLLIVDTFYFLHRSFHAYPLDLKNSKGEYTNISFGFAQSIIDLINKIKPSHIICGWESEEQPSFRKELYPQYQITRAQLEPIEEKVFSRQFPRVIQLIDAFNIPRITENGFEGDDVIGTIAKRASKEIDVIIATADQDMIQLVDEKISLFRPGRPPFIPEALFTPESVIEKYSFTPIQMIDYKALRGDPSDNIPGVKGIGEKIAKDLISMYGSLENVYANLENLKSKAVRQKLMDGKDMAFLSKQLATIIIDVPINFNLKKCEVHDFDVEKIRSLFQDLEFKSLLKNLDSFHSAVMGRMVDSLPEF